MTAFAKPTSKELTQILVALLPASFALASTPGVGPIQTTATVAGVKVTICLRSEHSLNKIRVSLEIDVPIHYNLAGDILEEIKDGLLESGLVTDVEAWVQDEVYRTIWNKVTKATLRLVPATPPA